MQKATGRLVISWTTLVVRNADNTARGDNEIRTSGSRRSCPFTPGTWPLPRFFPLLLMGFHISEPCHQYLSTDFSEIMVGGIVNFIGD